MYSNNEGNCRQPILNRKIYQLCAFIDLVQVIDEAIVPSFRQRPDFSNVVESNERANSRVGQAVRQRQTLSEIGNFGYDLFGLIERTEMFNKVIEANARPGTQKLQTSNETVHAFDLSEQFEDGWPP